MALRPNGRQLIGIELENFRSYLTPQFVRIAPITLMFGPNSAGKSTIMNALGLLRQSLVLGKKAGNLVVRGGDVDFGIASEIPNRMDPQGDIVIRLFFNEWIEMLQEITTSGDIHLFNTYQDFLRDTKQKKVGIGIRATVTIGASGTPELILKGYELYLGDHPTVFAEYERKDSGAFVSLARVDRDHPFWTWLAETHGLGILLANAVDHGRLAMRKDFSFPDEFLERGAPNVFHAYSNEKELEELSEYWSEIWFAAVGAMEAAERSDKEGRNVVYSPLLEELFAERSEATQRKIGKPLVSVNGTIDRIRLDHSKYLSTAPAEALSLLWQALGRELAYAFERGSDSVPLDISWRAGRATHFRDRIERNAEGVNYLEIRDPLLRLVQPNIDDYLSEMSKIASALVTSTETISARRGEFRRMFIVGEAGQPGEFDAANTSKEQLAAMNSSLREAGIPFSYGFEIFRPSEQASTDMSIAVAQVYDAFGRPKNIADVGTGTQYLLPVALALSSSRRPLLLIQEPESHLHPRMQGAVASLIASAGSAVDGEPIIVESHSREILLRMLGHIEGSYTPKLKSSGIALHYISRDGDVSEVSELRINGDGQLVDPWPEGATLEGFAPPAPPPG